MIIVSREVVCGDLFMARPTLPESQKKLRVNFTLDRPVYEFYRAQGVNQPEQAHQSPSVVAHALFRLHHGDSAEDATRQLRI